MYSEILFYIAQMLKIRSSFSKFDVFIATLFNFSALYFCFWGYPLAHCGLNGRNSWRWMYRNKTQFVILQFNIIFLTKFDRYLKNIDLEVLAFKIDSFQPFVHNLANYGLIRPSLGRF